MLLMQKCCCLDLRSGSIFIAIVRLLHWVVILTASVYTCLHVFGPSEGLFHYKVIINIEKNAYVIFLAIMVSLTGMVMEPLLIAGITQLNHSYIKSWMCLTVFSFIFSLMLALCFILHNCHVIRIGDNWFNDALCVLADVVFFFIPEYLMGPRLIPLLIVILIFAHLMLPVFHGFSLVLVYSYYRIYINPSQEAIAAARAGTTHNSATPINYTEEDYKASAPRGGTGSSLEKRLCQKCQSRQSHGENGGVVVDRCSSTPLLKPIETTC